MLHPERTVHLRVGRRSTQAALLLASALASACAGELASESGRALGRGDEGPEVQALYRYLRTYGYLPGAPTDPAVAHATASDLEPATFGEDLEQALRAFQVRYHLPADGRVNAATRALLRAPRCSGSDAAPTRRAAGFTTGGSSWSTRALSYSINSYSQDLPAAPQQAAIGAAFSTWAGGPAGFGMSAGLSFTPTGGGNIQLDFLSASDPGYGFDGPDGVLAYTYYPPSGHIYFDDEEWWGAGGYSGAYNLESTALHEIGHALGLGHSAEPGAVMYPYYNGVTALAADDVDGIRSLYFAPADIWVNPEYCAGHNEVFWATLPGATYYELYRATWWGDSSPALIYSGPGTSKLLNVPPSQTWYLSVRGCTSAGCSNLTNRVGAYYYGGPCQ